MKQETSLLCTQPRKEAIICVGPMTKMTFSRRMFVIIDTSDTFLMESKAIKRFRFFPSIDYFLTVNSTYPSQIVQSICYTPVFFLFKRYERSVCCRVFIRYSCFMLQHLSLMLFVLQRCRFECSFLLWRICILILSLSNSLFPFDLFLSISQY